MARKRGGLAGIWDRNKGAIKTLAPMALGAIPGVGLPLAAGARAAMEGFDRPGKGGIGFDVGRGARGAVTGALQGATGAGIRGAVGGAMGGAKAGGLQGMLTGGMRGAGQATQDYAQPVTRLFGGGGGGAAGGTTTPPTMPPGTPPPGPTNAPMTFGQALKQPQVLGAAIQGGLGMLPSPESDVAAERVGVERDRLGLDRQRLEMEEQDRQIELQRRQAIMQMLMPYLSQYLPQQFNMQG